MSSYPYTSGVTQTSGTCVESSCSQIGNAAPLSFSQLSNYNNNDLKSLLLIQPVAIGVASASDAFQFVCI